MGKVDVGQAVMMYRTQHLTVRQIGALQGVTGMAIWKALQKAGVQSREGERVNVACFICGQPYETTRARWRKQKRHFCSMPCYKRFMANPAYNPNRRGQRLARVVAGRLFELKSFHVVHHHDSDTTNNNPRNLAVFASQADHMSFERGGDALPIWDGRHL